MKAINFIAATLTAVTSLVTLSSVASAVSLVENKNYKEVYVNFEDAEKITVSVQGPRYRAAQAATMVEIKKLADDLYIVEQENLYYPMHAIYPPLPVVTMRDGATIEIEKNDLFAVRVLVPDSLEISAKVFRDPFGMTCMAYWTGFEYDMTSDSCVEIGTSGCSNPFEFRTLAACKRANLLN